MSDCPEKSEYMGTSMPYTFANDLMTSIWKFLVSVKADVLDSICTLPTGERTLSTPLALMNGREGDVRYCEILDKFAVVKRHVP